LHGEANSSTVPRKGENVNDIVYKDSDAKYHNYQIVQSRIRDNN